MIKFLLSLILLIPSAILYCTNYYVQPNGNDSNTGLSFNTAFKTIQAATNRVIAGDSVLVFNGNYKGFDHFYKASGTATKRIVYFAMGANVIINQSCGRGFDGLNIEGNDHIEVNGFKVYRIWDASGSGEDGIRAVLANHITIRHCEVDSCYRGIFTGYTDDFLAEHNICRRSYGEHGIYVSNNSDRVIIRNNLCFGNSKAAGIQLNPDLGSGVPGISMDVNIYNNICYNNRIGLNLQGIYYSKVYNNLIYNNGLNGGGNGMTFFLGDAATGCNDVKVYNNTVIVPSTSQWCILAIDSDSLFIKNNILLSFSAKGSLDIEQGCTNYFGDYNLLNNKMTRNQGSSYIDFKQWQALGHDLHSKLINNNNAEFVDISNFNFHLADQSQAINAGTDEVKDIINLDLDGILRPQDQKFDIGCYEKKGVTLIEDQFQDNKFKYISNGGTFSFSNLNQGHLVYINNLMGSSIHKGTEFSTATFVPGIYAYTVIDKLTKRRVGQGKFFIHKGF